MKRRGLSMIPWTRVSKWIKTQYKIEILVFQKFVIAARKRSFVELGQTGNMDEVPLTLSVPSNRTVVTKCAKLITVKTSGPENHIMLPF